MTKYADLHVHTSYSDSTFSPEQVVKCAVDKGLAAIAICDHDSVDGIGPCMELASEVGLEIIPGIEMSAEKVDAEIHILGLFINWQAEWFCKKLKEIQRSRVERVYKIMDKLKACDITIDAQEVFRLAGNNASVGRLHIAQAMLNSGRVKSMRDVFEKYIGFLKPCYVPYTKFSPEEAIQIILKAGGVPVIAHPDLMGHDEYIEEFVGYGLKGIEVYHTDHKPNVSKRYEEMSRRLGLVMTGGSDCHGLGKGRILMGTIRVPYELVEKLKAEATKIKQENAG
ncbi:MAG: PHP domain-containing protein [Candidatus Omnitrophota bacterium]|nr:PHP domain-containing protein [Candidatus Omnitrophota bacterium]